jgi:hypothetical protein
MTKTRSRQPVKKAIESSSSHFPDVKTENGDGVLQFLCRKSGDLFAVVSQNKEQAPEANITGIWRLLWLRPETVIIKTTGKTVQEIIEENK